MPLSRTVTVFGIKVLSFIKSKTYVAVGEKYCIVVDNESLLSQCIAQGFPGPVKARQPEFRC
jgi:hypothetical protein